LLAGFGFWTAGFLCVRLVSVNLRGGGHDFGSFRGLSGENELFAMFVRATAITNDFNLQSGANGERIF
jgi:hypothetical protein